MTHFGVICPTGSHLTACFPLAYELQQRGHRITFLNILDTRDKILAANFGFALIGKDERPSGVEAEILARRGKLSGIASFKDSLKTTEQDMRIILQNAPDAIQFEGIEALLVDQCSPSGGTVADFLNLPFVSLCNALLLNREISVPPMFTTWQYQTNWSAKLRNRAGYALSNRLISPIRRLIGEYRQKWNLPPHTHINDMYSTLAQISQQPSEFEFPRKNLPSHFHFTGPYHSGIGRNIVPFAWERLTGQPLIYALMGTIQNRLLPVFEAIADACVGLDVQLVISLGGGMTMDAMPTLVGNPLVVSYAPQLEILEKAAFTITHAGLNTVLESLTNGVPIIAIPIANDRPGVAARIAWVGVGEILTVAQLTGKKLRALIQKILIQDSYKDRALRLKSAIQNSGGVKQAASIIESVC
jgi:zeaxanthin glucosyltransferase